VYLLTNESPTLYPYLETWKRVEAGWINVGGMAGPDWVFARPGWRVTRSADCDAGNEVG
jgi:hypothetical protein